MPTFKPTLLTRFWLLSLLSVVALATGMGLAISSLLTRAVSTWEWQNTAALVQREVRMSGLERVFTAPGSLAERERWGREFSRMLTSLPEIARAKVWNGDAEILWSDSADLIGRRFPDNGDLRRALAGDVEAEVKALTKAEQQFEQGAYGWLAEVYVPIFGRDGRVVGVVEVYKRPDRLVATIRWGRTVVWTISLLGGATLYLVLLPLFRHVFRRELEGATLRAHAARLEAEIEQRTHQLLHAQRMQAVGLLAGGIAHDFNNLLTVIVGHAALLKTRLPDDASARTAADVIGGTAEQAARLTAQLLAFSRRRAPERRTIDVNDVVDELSSILRRLVGDNITLVTALAPTSTLVNADRAQLEQVILNLVVNARDAMPQGGHLSLTTARPAPGTTLADGTIGTPPGGWITLSVADTGSGMDEATRARIFEPFFTTKDPGKGTGLGLSTVHGVVRQHAGHVTCRTASGAGTTFTVYLPAAEQRRVDIERQPDLDDFRGAETVLLADDDDEVRALAAQVLRERGYTVLATSDAQTALETAQHLTTPIDLLVTDVIMPKLSGWQLGELVGTLHPRARVLYMTGYQELPLGGHVRMLRKPFTPLALCQAVREALDAAPAAHAPSGRPAAHAGR